MSRKVNLEGEKRPPRGESPPRGGERGGASATTGESARGGASSSSSGPAAPSTKLSAADKKLHGALTQMYGGIGMGVQGIATLSGDIGLSIAGANITTMASDTADAWLSLAQQNPRVRAMLEGMVQGSAVATLVGCHASMILPVLASRGVVPGEVANMFLTTEAKEYAAAMAAARTTAGQNGTHQ